jgi:hypothetical protein
MLPSNALGIDLGGDHHLVLREREQRRHRQRDQARHDMPAQSTHHRDLLFNSLRPPR